jgi:hypothetical protein
MVNINGKIFHVFIKIIPLLASSLPPLKKGGKQGGLKDLRIIILLSAIF